MGSLFKAVADDTRREILRLLNEKELTPGQMAKNFNITRPGLSTHLKILLDADLITFKKDKQERVYSINNEKIEKLVDYMNSLLG